MKQAKETVKDSCTLQRTVKNELSGEVTVDRKAKEAKELTLKVSGKRACKCFCGKRI